MTWQTMIAIYILLAYVLHRIILKKVSALPSRTKNLLWNYFITAILSTIFVLAFNKLNFSWNYFVILIIGTFNAFACYCQWRSIDISLSKTSIFTQADDLIAMLLGYILLNETKFLNPLLFLGIVLCVSSAFVFWKTKKEIILWILIYSIIWGIAIFSMRYFALEKVNILNYASAWYQGSLIGASLIFIFKAKEERINPINNKQLLLVIPLAIITWTCLMIQYKIFELTPITVAQPILQISEALIPTIIGLWLFKERKELKLSEKIAVASGLIGAIIIVIAY